MTDFFSYPLYDYPVALVDYIWVITFYVTAAFFLAALTDGYLLPPFEISDAKNDSSFGLAIKIILQMALQGFIAIALCAIMQKLPSPMDGVFGYKINTSLGVLIRNPALISVILFSLSKSLRGRLFVLYSRYDYNARIELERDIAKENEAADLAADEETKKKDDRIDDNKDDKRDDKSKK